MVTKKVLLAMLLIGVSMLNIKAQAVAKDDIQLVVSGDGISKEEATKTALRSAIEQAFGTFVSANTEMLNDEIIKDEIATVSSGNIKSFEYIAENAFDGKHFVTIKATVSIGRLVEYTKSKGAVTELAGATFAMNMKMRELNKQNELITLQNLFNESKKIMPHIFDYEIELGDPKVLGEKYELGIVAPKIPGENYGVEAKVILKSNKNTEEFYKFFHNTLSSLSLSKTEVEEYKKTNIPVERLFFSGRIKSAEERVLAGEEKFFTYKTNYMREYFLRNKFSDIEDFSQSMNIMIGQVIFFFKIIDNLGEYALSVATITDRRKRQLNPVKCDATFFMSYAQREGESNCLIIGVKSSNEQRMTRLENEYELAKCAPDELSNCPVFFPYKCGELLYSFKVLLCYTPDEMAKVAEIKIEPLTDK